MNIIQSELLLLKRKYNLKRQSILKRVARSWKYCKYQGCNKCIMTDGLVPKNDPFAGKYGPKD